MATPSVADGKEQVEQNWKSGAIGGATIAGSNMLIGSSIGPILGGVIGGTIEGGSTGDQITNTGFLLAGNNIGNSLSSSGSSANSNSVSSVK